MERLYQSTAGAFEDNITLGRSCRTIAKGGSDAYRSRSEAGTMLHIDQALRTRLLHLDVGGMVAILLKCATLKYRLGKCA